MPKQQFYWVDAPEVGRLAVVSRPREVGHFAELKAAGVDVLVSMLAPEEAEAVGLADQAALCANAGIEFHHLPILDFGVPSSVEPVERLVATLAERLAAGRGVAAHCFAGLGRSPLMIASVMIHHGIGASQACTLLSAARGRNVPEMGTQVAWLEAFERRPR